jgi:thiol-disulfide isomerase/thioredoxin
MNVILLIARLVLAGVFGVAGAAKLADPVGSRNSMSDFGVPGVLARPLGFLLPVAELVCAVALLPVTSAWWGAIGVLALLMLFIVAMSISLVRGRRPDCHCFGQVHSAPIGWNLVLRNVFLAVLAGLIVWQRSSNRGVRVLDLPASLTRSETATLGLAVAIAILAAFQFWALIHLLRQNGRLLLRIEALENKPAVPAEAPPPPGLPMNHEAPAFSLKDLAARMVTLDALCKQGKPVLLLFSEPGCGACDAALPEVAEWQREYRDRLLIVPISRGDAQVNRAKSEKHGLQNMLLQLDREVASAYLADQTPSGVLVRDGRVASSLALGTDAIRGLVVHAVLPPSVTKGDAVPSLKLADLEGQAVDLAHLRRRTLILFWNPSCGFCEQMLPDVKGWERNPPKDGPELLIVSAGAPEDIRKQEFRSRVLLDPYYGASQVFNSGGTPSAVLIDEEGRVASDVGVGAQEVLSLARSAPAVSA